MRPISVLPTDPRATTPSSPDDPLAPERLAALSKDELAEQLTTWAGRVAAGEARLLLYLGEFDERKGWAVTGVLSCAHWVQWRFGMGSKAAHERVRVARALRGLPETRTAFTSGQVSFSQVRALTRIATPDNEQVFLNCARSATGGQLERLVRGMRRAIRNKEKAEKKAAGEPVDEFRPQVRTRYDDDGNLTLTVRCTAPDGAVLLAALEAARSDLDTGTPLVTVGDTGTGTGLDSSAEELTVDPAVAASPEAMTASGDGSAERSADSSAEDSAEPKPEPEPEPESRRASMFDGLMQVARGFLDARGRQYPGKARRDRSKLTVHIDPLSGWARLADGELLPPGTLAAVDLPDTTPLRPFTAADLTRHDAGRSSRDVPQPLRDLLGTIDGERCRFPSCTRRRNLHAHHLQFWSDGGRTDLDNLVLLCARHHTLVHLGGFRLTLHPHTRALQVTDRDTIAVPHRPALPWRPADELDPTARIGPRTLPPIAMDKLDLHYAVNVLMQHAA